MRSVVESRQAEHPRSFASLRVSLQALAWAGMLAYPGRESE